MSGSTRTITVGLVQASRAVPDIAAQIARDQAEASVARMRARFVPFPGATGTRKLNIRSGRLVRALRVRSRTTTGTVRVRLGVLSTSPQVQLEARVQEFGAPRIRPRSGPNAPQQLAIPVGAALTARGTPRFANVRASASAFPRRVAFPGLIVGRRRSGGPFVPLFVRRREVSVPPRPFVTPEFVRLTRSLPAALRRIVPKAVRNAL